MRLLFVGQAPSRESDGHPPFTGRCGKFLAELLGTTQEQMLLDHDFINVLDRFPGKGPGGDKFPMIEAKAQASRKLDQLRGRRVVMLGHNVSRAFGGERFTYLSTYDVRNPENFADRVCLATVVPHPSGRNRFFNREENRMIVAKLLREMADSTQESKQL